MIMTVSQIKEILTAGGSLVIDASGMILTDLKQLAETAATSNAKLTIKNVSALTHEHLKLIASLAPGLITLDLR